MQPPWPHYDRFQSYAWNYEHAPEPVRIEIPPVPGTWTFCGMPVPSPLGVAAGPLLNGRWILYYASLGFDVLTYKTVRSVARECYPMPNLLPVQSGQLTGTETSLLESSREERSWAVSFGMPSQSPEVWRRDIKATRRALSKEKILSVSVVGSVQPEWSLEDLARDYAQCAQWAVESGADCIEANLSCPNVSTCDGQLYQHPGDASLVARRIREAIGDRPLILKIGKVENREEAPALLTAVAPWTTSLAMTNSLATTITSREGKPYFEGERRGICGEAIREASVGQTRLLAELIREKGMNLRLIGVGGVFQVEHVRAYLEAGAEGVHLATAVMQKPLIALEIRQKWAASPA